MSTGDLESKLINMLRTKVDALRVGINTQPCEGLVGIDRDRRVASGTNQKCARPTIGNVLALDADEQIEDSYRI